MSNLHNTNSTESKLQLNYIHFATQTCTSVWIIIFSLKQRNFHYEKKQSCIIKISVFF